MKIGGKIGIVTLTDGAPKTFKKKATAPTRKAASAFKVTAKPAPKAAKGKAAKVNVKKITTDDNEALFFSKSIKEIRALVNSDEGMSEESALKMAKVLLGSTIESVQLAEQTYRDKPTPHNGYILTNLVTQAQSMAKEIQLMQSAKQRLAEIADDAIMKGLRSLVFQISQSFIGINSAADEYAGKKSGKIKKRTEKAADDIAALAMELAPMMRDEILKNA